ncbi:hypothetical protein VTJ49DRAFT_3691 [Mycothermus thermophilus]|uniref:Uncharacterized protein n=1 Tax=Humicola insolens TaxID=85995 RepID=A0ABR3V7T8_HUMIN
MTQNLDKHTIVQDGGRARACLLILLLLCVCLPALLGGYILTRLISCPFVLGLIWAHDNTNYEGNGSESYLVICLSWVEKKKEIKYTGSSFHVSFCFPFPCSMKKTHTPHRWLADRDSDLGWGEYDHCQYCYLFYILWPAFLSPFYPLNVMHVLSLQWSGRVLWLAN